MAQDNSILIIGGLALAFFTLAKPITKTGDNLANTVGGVGRSIVDLTGDVTGITGAVSNVAQDTASLIGDVGQAGSQTIGIVTDVARGVRSLIGNVPKAGSILLNNLPRPRSSGSSGSSFRIPNPLTLGTDFLTNVAVKAATRRSAANIRSLKSSRVNVQVSQLSDNPSLLSVHTPLVKFTGTGSGSKKRSIKKSKSVSQPAPGTFNNPVEKFRSQTKSSSLTSSQKKQLQSNLDKLGF